MSSLDMNNAAVTDYENYVSDLAVAPKNTEGISDLKETFYTNTEWSQHWAYFNEHPELKSAILMKTIWDVGKSYTADPETKVILENITGMGKDTFDDILFNMDLCRYVGRDSFAEIIRADDGTLINLKPLDPSSIRIVVDNKGIITRYEQITKTGDKKDKIGVVHTFKPREIFHLSNNRFADQIHGISVIESLPETLKAELESFADTRKLMHRQAKPFIIYKLKTDDLTKIQQFQTKIQNIRDKCEDLIIPDDENILSWEVVQINSNDVMLAWRQDVINRFYRALGMPLILFGGSGSTESGGKMEYFAHEQVFEHQQRFIEKQVWNQLGLRIKLVPPTSMAQDLQRDEGKDAMQGLDIAPADTKAGVGA